MFKIKRILSCILTLTLIMTFVSAVPVKAQESNITNYVYDGYTIDYQISSKWDNSQVITIRIKNTGTVSILNWAVKYSTKGEIRELSNASIYSHNGSTYILKNAGYNFEIRPMESISFNYTVTGDDLSAPEKITLVSKEVEKQGGFDVEYKITDDWGTGFQANVTLTNNTEAPVEAWKLSFDSNFKISNIWNAKMIANSGNTYTVGCQSWSNSIPASSAITFGFTGSKEAGEEVAFKNFRLTEVAILEEIDLNDPTDSDSDGLPDVYESNFYGTDPHNPDTDGDGLNDSIEFKLGLNPLLSDTDGNGITDDREDTDGDGIINIEEINVGSNPAVFDTDGDGLNDGEEINSYNTSPTNIDTDEDGLTDSEELALGLDPTNPKTDGVTDDALRKFYQITGNDAISETLTSPDNWLIPSVSGNVAGLISNNLKLEQSSIDTFDDNRALLSPVVDVLTTYQEPLTLAFNCSSSFNDYDGNINNLSIFKYDGADLSLIDTKVDVGNKSLSAEISGEGAYFVLDIDEFLKSLGIDVFRNIAAEAYISADISQTSESEPETITLYDNYGVPAGEIANPKYLPEGPDETEEQIKPELFTSTNTSGQGTMGKADIVFVIDKTGSMGSAINNVKNNVTDFANTLVNEYNIDANFALVEFQDITYDGLGSTFVHKSGLSNWFTDVNKFKAEINSLVPDGGGDSPETPIDGLEMARRLDFRSNANRFIILITDASYKNNNRYDIGNLAAMTNLFIKDKAVVSVISYNEATYGELFGNTGGLYGNIYDNFSKILIQLANKIGDITNTGEWLLLDDYQAVKLASPLSENKDTDEDGQSDRSELISSYQKDLTKLVEALLALNSVPRDLYKGETAVTVWSYLSNPVLPDTDFDGIDDAEDISPRDNSFKGELHYVRNKKDLTSKITFSVDYRNFFKSNQTYMKDISVFSSLLAADIYQGTYITVTDGAKGGSDDPASIGSLFGLSDVENSNISAADYTVDKDDVTEFVIGHRSVEYRGVNKEIIILSIRGTNGTNAEWSSNFDVGADTEEYYNATGSDHPDWKSKQNHKGFDVAANRVLDKVNSYLSRHGLSGSTPKSILVVGHSRGAAIANLLGARFEDEPGFSSFTYTFAAPNPTTASNASSYKTIFNIVNEDDIIPCLPLSEWGFKKYGVTKSISVESHYENKWGGRQEGTWEWLVGDDYNNDGGTQRTLGCFKNIARNRNELYVLDSSSDGKVWENNLGHTTLSGAKKELAELTRTLENEKLLKFCKLSIVGGGFLTPYHVEVNYCPAYLMQSLSNMTTGVGPKLGHDVKGKYAFAKASFVASSGKIVIGGMVDPHLQITYYLIAYNNFVSKV